MKNRNASLMNSTACYPARGLLAALALSIAVSGNAQAAQAPKPAPAPVPAQANLPTGLTVSKTGAPVMIEFTNAAGAVVPEADATTEVVTNNATKIAFVTWANLDVANNYTFVINGKVINRTNGPVDIAGGVDINGNDSIMAEGNFTLAPTAKIEGSGSLTLVTPLANTITNAGTIGTGNIGFLTGRIINTGTIGGSNEVRLIATGTIDSSGLISAGSQLIMDGKAIDLSGSVSSGGKVTLTADDNKGTIYLGAIPNGIKNKGLVINGMNQEILDTKGLVYNGKITEASDMLIVGDKIYLNSL